MVALVRDDEGVDARLVEEIAALRARIVELEKLADSDTLTPLPNRRAFLRELDRLIRHVARYGEAAAVMFVDVDGLKTVNDAHGHHAGDAVLLCVAGLLPSLLRATDVVARIGGDEFGLLLNHLDEAAARDKADLIHRAIAEECIALDAATINVGVSVGVTVIRGNDTADAALARADADMYVARRQARSDR